jgi:glutathione S-transferase
MSDDKVILHVLPPSSNSGVIRCFLLAAGIPFEEVNAYGQTRTPEFIAKFPNNCCPAIEHGDFTLCENSAILRYLCKAFPDQAGKFYSNDLHLSAKIDMVLDMINTGVCVLVSKASYPTLGYPLYAGDVAAMDATQEHTKLAQTAAGDALLEYLQTKICGIFLAQTQFLLTDDLPTIADFRFAPMLSQAKVAFPMPPRIVQYLNDMEQLVPGYAEGMKPVDAYNSQFWIDQA